METTSLQLSQQATRWPLLQSQIGSGQQAAEIVQTFQLRFKTAEDAVDGETANFGMAVCDGAGTVSVSD